MFEGKPEVFDAFTSHDDEITELGDYGVRLAGNAWSHIQAVDVRYDRGSSGRCNTTQSTT